MFWTRKWRCSQFDNYLIKLTFGIFRVTFISQIVFFSTIHVALFISKFFNLMLIIILNYNVLQEQLRNCHRHALKLSEAAHMY